MIKKLNEPKNISRKCSCYSIIKLRCKIEVYTGQNCNSNWKFTLMEECKHCFSSITEKSKLTRHLFPCLMRDHSVYVKMIQILSKRTLCSLTTVLLNYSHVPWFRRAEKHVPITYFMLKSYEWAGYMFKCCPELGCLLKLEF